jgi:hypothetical protein
MIHAVGSRAIIAAACCAALFVGCGEDDEPFDDADCTNVAFDEVNPANTTTEFRSMIENALVEMCQSQTDGDLGYASYQSIASLLVEVDVLADLTDFDYSTVLVFYGLTPDDITREDAIAMFERDLAGYMWGNRIYLHPALDPPTLAATLVHEVNHVLNRSDENYYLPLDREVSDSERTQILNSLTEDPARAFTEEYRAFYLEEVYAGAPLDIGAQQSMRDLKLEVRNLYGWVGLDVDQFPDVPDGVLVPDDDGWSMRPESLCGPELTWFPCD